MTTRTIACVSTIFVIAVAGVAWLALNRPNHPETITIQLDGWISVTSRDQPNVVDVQVLGSDTFTITGKTAGLCLVEIGLTGDRVVSYLVHVDRRLRVTARQTNDEHRLVKTEFSLEEWFDRLPKSGLIEGKHEGVEMVTPGTWVEDDEPE